MLTVGEAGGAGAVVAEGFQRDVGFGVVVPEDVERFFFFVDGDFRRRQRELRIRN